MSFDAAGLEKLSIFQRTIGPWYGPHVRTATFEAKRSMNNLSVECTQYQNSAVTKKSTGVLVVHCEMNFVF